MLAWLPESPAEPAAVDLSAYSLTPWQVVAVCGAALVVFLLAMIAVLLIGSGRD